jgi:hypothetical protein
MTTNLTAIPLLDNWAVTFNNTVQWGSPQDNPCAVIGLFSSLASPANASIQIVEYENDVMDIVIRNASNPSGLNIISMSWSNPLTVSLISGNLHVSSSAGTFDYGFQSFPLAYVTAGSANNSYVCYGGEVDVQVIQKPVIIMTFPVTEIAVGDAILAAALAHACNDVLFYTCSAREKLIN